MILQARIIQKRELVLNSIKDFVYYGKLSGLLEFYSKMRVIQSKGNRKTSRNILSNNYMCIYLNDHEEKAHSARTPH